MAEQRQVEGMERRIAAGKLELREGADGPVIAGYAAVFDVWSEDLGGFIERILPGFFAPVLGDDIRALWQHDASLVLGRTRNGTLRLAEDATGLAVEISPPDSQWARDAVVSIRRGDVSQMSFSFKAAQEQWEPVQAGPAQRTLIRAAALYDVSPVTFAAYPTTSVGVRQHVDDLRAQVERAAGLDRAREDLTRAREDLRLRLKTRR
jgi:HK97 family phage prohead protease